MMNTMMNYDDAMTDNENFAVEIIAFYVARRPQLRSENGHRAVAERPVCGD